MIIIVFNIITIFGYSLTAVSGMATGNRGHYLAMLMGMQLSGKQAVQFFTVFGQSQSTRIRQFLSRTVAVEDADASDSAMCGSAHIVISVADHDSVFTGGTVEVGQRMGDNGVFVRAGRVKTGPSDKGEECGQPEMIQDPSGEHLRFGGGERYRPSFRIEPAKKIGDAGVYAAFEQPLIPIVFPVVGDGAVRISFGEMADISERNLQGRPEEDLHIEVFRQTEAHSVHGISDTAADARSGVHDGPVQIEQYILIHELSLLSAVRYYWYHTAESGTDARVARTENSSRFLLYVVW